MKGYFLFFVLLGGLAPTQNLEAATGPHGGEIKPAIGTPAKYNLELVIRSAGDSDEREIHVYGLDQGNQPVNLYQSGYGGLMFRLGSIELPLAFYKVDEEGHVNNDQESLHHYRAIGKFPKDPGLELEVTIAFPTKSGTGKARFSPFQKNPTS